MVIAVALATSAGAHAERVHHFTVAIDRELTELEVTACFDGQPPEQLVTDSLDAGLALREIRNLATGKEIIQSGHIPLDSVGVDGCLFYRVDVSRGINRHDRARGGNLRRVGADLTVSASFWLWRPQRLAADEDVELRFDLPEGFSVSTPWSPVGGTERPTFRLGHTPYDWPAWVAFGRFEVHRIDVAGAQLRVAVLDGSPPVNESEIIEWVADAAGMVGNLYKRFPYRTAQVLVIPNGRGREPTPWAFVVRGGSPAVHFVINQRRPIQEFYDDWTAAHEFSHLFLPFVDSGDAWVSEGLASYYQNVLRARAGHLSPQEAWRKLDAGFDRGRRQTNGMTLAEATERMRHSRMFMRVYWSGTAIMLMADLELRKRSGGAQSLDTALAMLGDCCLQTDREWTAVELFSKLDELTGDDVFMRLLNEYVNSAEFPDLSQAYRELGLVSAGGKVFMVSDAPFAHLRDAIMSHDGGPLIHANSE